MAGQTKGANARLIFAEETTLGTAVVDPTKFRGFRMTPGETLGAQINKLQSQELNQSRAVRNLIGGNKGFSQRRVTRGHLASDRAGFPC